MDLSLNDGFLYTSGVLITQSIQLKNLRKPIDTTILPNSYINKDIVTEIYIDIELKLRQS